VAPLLPELSLAVLGGRDREHVLRHLSQCAVCSVELEQLSTVADGVLTLAPVCEPPAGFELALRRRMVAEGQHHHSPASHRGNAGPTGARRVVRSRPAMAVAAVALAILLAFGGGWLLRTNRSVDHGGGVGVDRTASTSATLMSGRRPVGRLVLSGAHPDWLTVSVRHLAGSPTVECMVMTTTGHMMTVGTFSLASGSGTWSAPLPVAPAAVAGATLLDTHGRVVATAQVRRPAG
jgi:hypothetical protein